MLPSLQIANLFFFFRQRYEKYAFLEGLGINYNKIIRVLTILVIIAHFVAVAAFLVPAITLAQDAPSIMASQPTIVPGPSGSSLVIPVSVSSRGPLPLSQVYIAGRLTDTFGTVVADSMAGPIDIPVGTRGNLTFVLPVAQGGNLTCRFDIGFSTPPLLSVSVELDGQASFPSGGG